MGQDVDVRVLKGLDDSPGHFIFRLGEFAVNGGNHHVKALQDIPIDVQFAV